MHRHRSFDSTRRRLLAGGRRRRPEHARRTVRARARRHEDAHRHHRLRPYRRHDRRAVGQGRPSGDVLVARSAGVQGHWSARLGPLAHAGTVAEAIAFGDVVFLAVPYGAMPEIGRESARAEGQDRARRLQRRRGARRRRSPTRPSANGIGVTSQKYLPGARLVRAFNTHRRTRSSPREANRARPEAADPDRRRRRRGGQGRGARWSATPASSRSSSAGSPMRAASSAARRATARA